MKEAADPGVWQRRIVYPGIPQNDNRQGARGLAGRWRYGDAHLVRSHEGGGAEAGLGGPYRGQSRLLVGLRQDRLGGGGAAAGLAVPDAGHRPGRPGGGPRRCRADHQPDPAPGSATGSGRPCTGWPTWPGPPRRPRGHGRQRPADLVGRARAVGVCRSGRDSGYRPAAGLAAPSRRAGCRPSRRKGRSGERWPAAGRSAAAAPAGRGPRPGLAGHTARYGPAPSGLGRRQREALIAEVDRAGLTGRGGAGFPTAGELAAVAAGHAPVVVANGASRQARAKGPGADGPLTGARAGRCGARGRDHRRQRGGYRSAPRRPGDRRRGRGRTRPGSPGSGSRSARRRVFVAGQASAVVRWVQRGVPAPTATPPRLAKRGLRGAPTLLQNVETLAHLALIARYGAAWFRSAGT